MYFLEKCNNHYFNKHFGKTFFVRNLCYFVSITLDRAYKMLRNDTSRSSLAELGEFLSSRATQKGPSSSFCKYFIAINQKRSELRS